MSIASDTGVYFDPYDVAINADPYPAYERLREEAPVYYNERYDFWALSRHDDVYKALLNWQTFSNTRSDITASRWKLASAWRHLSHWVAAVDRTLSAARQIPRGPGVARATRGRPAAPDRSPTRRRGPEGRG